MQPINTALIESDFWQTFALAEHLTICMSILYMFIRIQKILNILPDFVNCASRINGSDSHDTVICYRYIQIVIPRGTTTNTPKLAVDFTFYIGRISLLSGFVFFRTSLTLIILLMCWCPTILFQVTVNLLIYLYCTTLVWTRIRTTFGQRESVFGYLFLGLFLSFMKIQKKFTAWSGKGGGCSVVYCSLG